MARNVIGIMSMQRILNYGSFLQAYGLKKLIMSIDNDSDIRFLDYRPGPPLLASPKGRTNGLSRIAQKVSEYGKVDTSILNKICFFNHKRTYARRNFPILGLTSVPNYDYHVDLQILGSDEVFNCVQTNTNVGFSRDLFGHNSPAKRLISYAGSFGNTTIEKIKQYGLIDQLAEDLSRFSDISVRDENSYHIVKELIGRNSFIHVDPVLAYDYMNECTKIPSHRIIEEPYLVVYGYSGRFTHEENSIIRAYATTKELKVICLGGLQGCCDKFVDCTPFELLALFRDAEGIVTDTFHGSIFSIINEKRFITIIRRSQGKGYGNEEKLHYLLKSSALSDCGTFSLTSDNIQEALTSNPDYGATKSILKQARISAQSYLQRIIAAEESTA